MSQKTKCADCWLAKTCGAHNDVKGWGNPNARMVILLDAPGDTLAEKLVIWLLWRMSLTGNDVYIDYVFKCALPDGKPKKVDLLLAYKTCWNHAARVEALRPDTVLVVSGNWGCKFIVGEDIKHKHGKKDEDTEAWVTYGFKYPLMNPAECVEISCVLWTAAVEAGLTPKVNLNVEPFRFPSKKLAGV